MLKMKIIFPSKIPLLDRRGGSRPSEASVWRRGGGPSSFASLRMTESLTESNPPPHLVRFASLIGLGTPPGQEGSLVFYSSYNTFSFTDKNAITFFLGSPYNTFRMTGPEMGMGFTPMYQPGYLKHSWILQKILHQMRRLHSQPWQDIHKNGMTRMC